MSIRTLALLVAALILLPTSSFAQADESGARAGGVRLAAPSPPDAASLDALARRIDRILAGSDVTDGRVGIHAVDMDTGAVIYSRGADLALNPASNMKLVTAAAALDFFGPQRTFGTDILADGLKNGVVSRALYVRGQGEAFLLFEDFIDWAAELRQKGVVRVEGDIVIDDSVFDAAYLPPGFEQKNADAAYRPAIGAVSVNFNAVTAVISPAEQVGATPSVRLMPPNNHVEVVNRASTRSGAQRRLMVTSEPTEDGTRLVIDGYTGVAASPQSVRKRIDNPPVFAGAVFKAALDMVGIPVTGRVRVGVAPDSARLLLNHQSQPLSYVALAMNKWSNNFMAEQLLRVLGVEDDAPSTWSVARERIVRFLVDKVGLTAGSFQIHNGSGLYSGNEVSAAQFVALLRYMDGHPNAPEFKASLTISGVDGTLRNRLRGAATEGRIRGKTGTLNEVSALSGYATRADGRRIAFSVLFDDTPRRGWFYRSVQDRIVEALVDQEL